MRRLFMELVEHAPALADLVGNVWPVIKWTMLGLVVGAFAWSRAARHYGWAGPAGRLGDWATAFHERRALDMEREAQFKALLLGGAFAVALLVVGFHHSRFAGAAAALVAAALAWLAVPAWRRWSQRLDDAETAAARSTAGDRPHPESDPPNPRDP